MDSSNLVASQYKVKPMIPLHEQPEPWPTIGLYFAAECAAIVSCSAAPQPTSKPRPKPRLTPNDLRGLRESLDMTQKEVGRLVGASPQQVSLAEYGMRPKWQRIIRAALEGLLS